MPFSCRAHVVPLPCRAAKRLECAFPFDLHSAAVSDSHLPCHAHAMLRPNCSSQGHSTARPSLDGRVVPCPCEERHGRSMASVNQTRPHCVNQMGKTHSKRLAARHGRATTLARHGNGMLCVNRP